MNSIIKWSRRNVNVHLGMLYKLRQKGVYLKSCQSVSVTAHLIMLYKLRRKEFI